MANHNAKVLELLHQIDDARIERAALYDTPTGRRSLTDQARINSLTATIRDLARIADVHSRMAVRQELAEIAARLDGQARF